MYKVEIWDGYGGVTEEWHTETLEEALKDIKEHVLERTSVDNIKLFQELPLEFTMAVHVKA